MAEKLWLQTDKGVWVLVKGMEIPPPAHDKREMVEFIAIVDNRTVASLRLELRDYHVWLLDLSVDEDFRRMGIGSLLLKECLNTAKFAGYTNLYALIYSDKARAFCEAHGGAGETKEGFAIYGWGL